MALVTRVSVNLTWTPPDVGTGILVSYDLRCSVLGNEVLRALLKPRLDFILEELLPATSYVCSISGATSGGDGPSAIVTFTTEG